MSFRNVSDVDPGVIAGDKLFAFPAVLVECLEPLEGRSIEIFRLFDRMDHRLNSVHSLERQQRRTVQQGAYSKDLPKVISRWLSAVVAVAYVGWVERGQIPTDRSLASVIHLPRGLQSGRQDR